MNIKDFKWTEKRFGTTFANILKKLGGLSKDATDGSIEYKDDQGNVTKLVTDSTFSSLLAKNGLIEVKWQELKDKRDNGQLIPGALYRITDYNCTTTQENTRSAGHQFDIVLLALSENKLAEEGWAMMHDNIYDVTFSDGVTLKCYLYNDYEDEINIVLVSDITKGTSFKSYKFKINENVKTATVAEVSGELILVGDDGFAYNYFQNSNLSAWKVWYCLDNDKSRFAWASDILSSETNNPMIIIQNGEDYSVYVRQSQLDNENGCAWVYSGDANNFDGDESLDLEDIVYTQLTNPNIGDIALSNNAEIGNVIVHNISVGRGVIYRLIDEFNNDIKYDFKNIQFKRKLHDGAYDADYGHDTWCYTLNVWYNDMCQDASIVGNTLLTDEDYVVGVYDNNFGCATALDIYVEGVNTFAFVLGDNVVLSYDDDGYYGIHSNRIESGFYINTIGKGFSYNIIGNGFNYNRIGNDFCSNIIGNNFYRNIIGSEFTVNTIGNFVHDNTIGDGVNSNTIGSSFSHKTIGNHTFYKNYGNNGVELATKEDLN